MTLLRSSLDAEAYRLAEEFLQRFHFENRTNIERVLACVDSTAREFFAKPELHDRYAYRRRQEIDPTKIMSEKVIWDHFAEVLGGTDEDACQGFPFFHTYAIGGNLTKVGERPDIDLMVATNMQWINGQGYGDDRKEWFVRRIVEEFDFDFNIEIPTELPDHYILGDTKGKGLIRLRPKSEVRKPIDILYFKSCGELFINEAEFEALDVDESGQRLPKLILYRRVN